VWFSESALRALPFLACGEGAGGWGLSQRDAMNAQAAVARPPPAAPAHASVTPLPGSSGGLSSKRALA